jgi:hypothetical protein
LLSMKAMRLCHISAYLVLWAIKYPPGGVDQERGRRLGPSHPLRCQSLCHSFTLAE